MTDGSIVSYRSALRRFNAFLDGRGINDVASIDKNVIREYIRILREERKVSSSTLDNQLSCISSFLDYLVYEEMIDVNIALVVRKRYLRRYKSDGRGDAHTRKLITTPQLKLLVESILNPRDRALVLLLAKTGIRRNELISIDIGDVDIANLKIVLKPKAKRSNRVVFFDEECAAALQEWLIVRERNARDDMKALFITTAGGGLDRNSVYRMVTEYAARVGLHDPKSKRLEDHFTPHCLRHWFTTCLRRNGMQREMIQELRGDVRRDAIDIYYHIDEEQLRKAYLEHIPRLGIY